ncbi:hypothetical protein [Geothermobacter hydrogeniphilus]|nr:hypothetical protein [Geothermobacter hydrogeniphilus]
MKKDRFSFVCLEAESGHDAFVNNATVGEEGRVLECAMQHIVVETIKGDHRCWDYHDCEEVSRRKEEWPYR